MTSDYPVPHSHRTFNFGSVTIDSNFDSGNCSDAVKISNNSYEIWIGIDHPDNKYRTWFHFSIQGLSKGFTVNFKIKNQQNQSKLLNEGLVPVYREESSQQWKRIRERINLSSIEYNDGWIQWPFRHTMTSDEKVYFAFFYPWSNVENSAFLDSLQEQTADDKDIYFHRATIAKTIEGRPIQFVAISSPKGKMGKEDKIEDNNLFVGAKKPALFQQNKKVIVIGARVHPGEVPASHVMTGILKELTENNEKMRRLRDHFVFYIFPIFNPDGVARGHYRVDTKGINLNRCYINPTIKGQPAIYAVKKIIMHCHENNKFYAFLDLHAHAARKGTFIYGNWSNELKKQLDACLFPRILALNSIDFQYEGSSFTEKNMSCKDRGDHMSKQGSGRVAIFKLTKNAKSWTLQCNYNISKQHNILESEKLPEDTVMRPTQQALDYKIISQYRNGGQREPKQFFTIQTYHKLGKQICQSFLDLAQINPCSRIDNPKNYFKSVQNLKMNLAVALLKMAPTRFEKDYKKIYNSMINSENKDAFERSIKAIYLLVIKNARIQNIGGFLKDGDRSSIIIEEPKKLKSSSTVKRKQPNFSSLLERNSSNEHRDRNRVSQQVVMRKPGTLDAMRDVDLFRSTGSFESDESCLSPTKAKTDEKISNILEEKLKLYHRSQKKATIAKVNLRIDEFNQISTSISRNLGSQSQSIKFQDVPKISTYRLKIQELPLISRRPSINVGQIKRQIPMRKGSSAKDSNGVNFS